MFSNKRPYRIEWQDCDPAGIVFYPRYFAMFDTSTTTLFEKALGMRKRDFIKHYDFIGYPMIDTRAVFHIPGVFGDDVEILTAVTEVGRSSFSIEHKIMKEGQVAVEGWEKRVWVGKDPVNPERLKSKPLPPEVVEKLSK
ncbi:MAG TPA: thioesterase family protein [Xanthobacteraceae bacterium]|nr:thioesterase family protein [Xanthobacteraceae bacterium]